MTPHVTRRGRRGGRGGRYRRRHDQDDGQSQRSRAPASGRRPANAATVRIPSTAPIPRSRVPTRTGGRVYPMGVGDQRSGPRGAGAGRARGPGAPGPGGGPGGRTTADHPGTRVRDGTETGPDRWHPLANGLPERCPDVMGQRPDRTGSLATGARVWRAAPAHRDVWNAGNGARPSWKSRTLGIADRMLGGSLRKYHRKPEGLGAAWCHHRYRRDVQRRSRGTSTRGASPPPRWEAPRCPADRPWKPHLPVLGGPRPLHSHFRPVLRHARRRDHPVRRDGSR